METTLLSILTLIVLVLQTVISWLQHRQNVLTSRRTDLLQKTVDTQARLYFGRQTPYRNEGK